MIDFDKGQKQLNKFTGSEKKTTIFFDGNIYMLKYPDPIRAAKLKAAISYKNNQFSEYIGSRIFNSCGIIAQETVLGYYTDTSGKRKVVVGCKDFTHDGGVLYEIDKLANDIAPDEEKLKATIENVNRIIDETELIKDKKSIKDGFWNMFVVDALIGNKDRHFGNWGILVKNNEIAFAPIYDCGSSLSALLDDDEMKQLLNMPNELKNTEYNLASVYYMRGERVRYHEIFKSPPTDLIEAIERIVPRIRIAEICNIIDSTPQMTEIRKTYLKEALAIRYDQILLPAFRRL
ncbi:MAG: HipA domain-containing protein [Lachnospiraceae bacterium]|nr:HipA domain-containing protein [Lachnospiraceae bacterium]